MVSLILILVDFDFCPIVLGRVIFTYFPNASDQFLFNSEGGGIKPSFKGVEGWGWL